MSKLNCVGCDEYVDTTNENDLCYDCETEESENDCDEVSSSSNREITISGNCGLFGMG